MLKLKISCLLLVTSLFFSAGGMEHASSAFPEKDGVSRQRATLSPQPHGKETKQQQPKLDLQRLDRDCLLSIFTNDGAASSAKQIGDLYFSTKCYPEKRVKIKDILVQQKQVTAVLAEFQPRGSAEGTMGVNYDSDLYTYNLYVDRDELVEGTSFIVSISKEKPPAKEPQETLSFKEKYVSFAIDLLQGKCSFEGIENVIDDVVRIIIYTYPFATTESYFFEQLNKLDSLSQMTQNFLWQLALEAFPNGIENMRLAKGELKELRKKLRGNCSLFSMVDSIQFPTPTIEKSNPNADVVNVADMSIDLFCNALLIRDRNLFWNVLPSIITDYKSPVIQDIGSSFSQTTLWVRLQVILAQEEKRKEVFNKFLEIGKLLMKVGNFHGAAQIHLGLSDGKVVRLLNPEGTVDDKGTIGWWGSFVHQDSQEELNFLNLMTSSANYRHYRNLLSASQKDAPCLPMFSLAAGDVEHTSTALEENMDMSSNPVGALETLQTLANVSEMISKTKTIPDPETDEKHQNLVREIHSIDEGTLAKIVDICFDFESNEGKKVKGYAISELKKLKEWTPWDVGSFLVNNGFNKGYVQSLFKGGLYNGINILEHLGPDRNTHRTQMYRMGFTDDMVKHISGLVTAASPGTAYTLSLSPRTSEKHTEKSSDKRKKVLKTDKPATTANIKRGRKQSRG